MNMLCEADYIHYLEEEVAKLRAKLVEAQTPDELLVDLATIGVGDDSGKLFVHGTYDSIHAVRTTIFELQKLRNENKLLNEKLGKQAEELVKTREMYWRAGTEADSYCLEAQDAESKLKEIQQALCLLAKMVEK